MFLFWLCCMACGILIPQPGRESRLLAVRAPSPNYWTTREFPKCLQLRKKKVTYQILCEIYFIKNYLCVSQLYFCNWSRVDLCIDYTPFKGIIKYWLYFWCCKYISIACLVCISNLKHRTGHPVLYLAILSLILNHTGEEFSLWRCGTPHPASPALRYKFSFRVDRNSPCIYWRHAISEGLMSL